MLLFILIILIFLIVVQGYLFYFEKEALKRLEVVVEPTFQRTGIAQEITVKVSCTNARRMILPIVHMTLIVPDVFHFEGEVESFAHQKSIKATFTLLSYQRRNLYFKLSPCQRGYYDLRLQLTCVDFLGLKHVSLDHDILASIIVHPRNISIDASSFYRTLTGNHSVRRFIHPDPLFFNGVRPYQSFDSQKDIDWKATARTQQLQVKQYEYTSDASVTVYLGIPSLLKLTQEEDDFIEMAVSWSASFIREAFYQQATFLFDTNAYGKIYYEPHFSFLSTHIQYQAYLDEMACVSRHTPVLMKDFLEKITFNKQGTRYFLVTRSEEDIPDAWLMYWLSKGINLTLVVMEQTPSLKPCAHLFLKGGNHP